jgi:hypothetical protein
MTYVLAGGGMSASQISRDREWAVKHLTGIHSNNGTMTGNSDSSDSGSSNRRSGHVHYHFEKSGDHNKAMRSLSLCDSHIIGQSSFGWWAAYLANSSEVVAPRSMFNDRGPRFEVDDYFLPWWTLLSSNPDIDRIVGFI